MNGRGEPYLEKKGTQNDLVGCESSLMEWSLEEVRNLFDKTRFELFIKTGSMVWLQYQAYYGD